MPMGRAFAAVVLLAGGLTVAAPAAQTEFFLDDATAQFAEGDATTSTLTFDGFIAPPVARERVGDIDADAVWDVAVLDGAVYTATGHDGKLFRLSEDGGVDLVHDFEEAALYALLPLEDGLLVAASPGGTLYFLEDGEGEPQVDAQLGAELVWDVVEHGDGLVAATGSPAALIRVEDDATTSTLAKMDFALNVLDLAPIPGGDDLAVATQGPGYVVRVSADGTMRVLIDPEQEEVRRVAVLPDGSVIGAVNGERSPGQNVLDRTPGNQARGNQKPQPESFIVRAYPGGIASEWWTSPESPIHDMHVLGDGGLLVAAGQAGNLYRVTAEGETDRVGVAHDDFVLRLSPAGDGVAYAGTASEAGLYRFRPEETSDGRFESRVFDAKGIVNWGRIRARVLPGDGAVALSVRTGNTKEPDETWQDWSEPADFNDGEFADGTPPGRFLQYAIDFDVSEAPRAIDPLVDFVRVFYTRPNEAPEVSEVVLSNPTRKGNGPPNQAPPTVRVDAFPEPNPGALELAWKAADQNNDTLRFAVALRGAEDEQWTTLEEDLEAPPFLLETRVLPDGYYRVRVTASDRITNPGDQALESQAESPLFLVDNLAPDIIMLSVVRESDEEVTIRFRVEDPTSVVVGAAWSPDFGEYRLLTPEDGAYDQRSETFRLVLTGEEAARGALVVLAASDEAGNTVLSRVRLD